MIAAAAAPALFTPADRQPCPPLWARVRAPSGILMTDDLSSDVVARRTLALLTARREMMNAL
jgi:hypothetical protein